MAEGNAFESQPTKGDQMAARKRGSNKIQGEWWIGTNEKYNGKEGKPGQRCGDAPTGRLTSTEFKIRKPYITFRIGGGNNEELQGVRIVIEGEEYLGAWSMMRSEVMQAVTLDVRNFIGKKAKIVVVDEAEEMWGYINVDDFRASDEPEGTVLIPIKPVKLKDEWSTFPLYKRVGYDQHLRPQFHFTSRMGWLNDPNGMVYYDGEWHMLFQHFAKGNQSGAKSWGNAVSTDLIHWKQLPHAINPYDNVVGGEGIHAIWSGSAVVDVLNGLGKQEGKTKTLFALFSATSKKFFQGAAYSTDRGRTWTKIDDGKPVIPHQEGRSKGQRDPRIFYYAPGKFYVTIMMIGGSDRAVRLWKSTDLLNWEIICDIPNKAAECIDMYTVAVDGDKNKMRWVIADAGTNYEVGDFDGKKWTGSGEVDEKGRAVRYRFDYGDSYYAAQAFNQGPDGRVVHIGWLRSKAVGYRPFLEAGMPFTQQMSVPAEITLRTTPGGIRMYRNPVKEIEKLYVKTTKLKGISAKKANSKLKKLDPELIDMTVEFKPAGNVTLNVRGLKINYDDTAKEFNFNNSKRVKGMKAGMLTLPKERQRKVRDDALKVIPAPIVDGTVKLRVLVDRASLELFVNDGQAAASFVVVPEADNRKISIEDNDKQEFVSVVVNELKSAWTK
jgi:sucrose-6-phosphate hydrolase SacC (GH32 family)